MVLNGKKKTSENSYLEQTLCCGLNTIEKQKKNIYTLQCSILGNKATMSYKAENQLHVDASIAGFTVANFSPDNIYMLIASGLNLANKKHNTGNCK